MNFTIFFKKEAHKALTIKEKTDKLDFIKVQKNFCLSEFMTKRILASCRTVELICNTSVKGYLLTFFCVGNYF
jgi:hypothetical protein